ncbi:MAG: energy transducer TonB [Opitutales bacterium]|nr:energy transducer TonB [Opitutales bacterium]
MKEKNINPPTIGKRPPTALLYGIFIAALLFLLLPLTQLISSVRPPDTTTVSGIDDAPPPPPDMDITPPEEKQEEEEIEEMEEAPPPPDLSMLELSTDADITSGFGASDFSFNFDAKGALDDLIFNIGDVDKRPTPKYTKAPIHPAELKRMKIEGTVIVEFVIDENGNVLVPKIYQSPNDGFNKNALDAIRKWKFNPAEKGGKKVKVRVRQPIDFKLNN